MCGRYGMDEPGELVDRYELLSNTIFTKPRYNVAPTQKMPVIVQKEHREVEEMQWGLIPFWAKDPKIGSKMINARAEGITEKPSFKRAIVRQRCLVPATYFYEWQATKDGKVPHLIKLKNEKIFSFAGIYDESKDTDGNIIRSYSIITTEANTVMQKVHHRMPVILDREEEARWLDPDMVEPEQITQFLNPYDPDQMELFPISTLVNSPKNDVREILTPLITH
jgi:putative SOS response-associated peptidase YedK